MSSTASTLPPGLSAEYDLFRQRGAGWIPLQGRAHLSFTGPDRARYLNGQLTANIARAKTGTVIPACVTTAKGRLCAEVFATILAEEILIDTDPALAEPLLARLEKYIVADQVEVRLLETPPARIHLAGPLAISAASAYSGQASVTPVNRTGLPGVEATVDSPEWLAWVQLEFPPLSPALLETLRIEQGRPVWGAELDENTFPSEAGLDRTHVDFHKGCYIGQEVISRLESVGQANRALRGFAPEDRSLRLSSCMRLFTADDPSRDLGRITSATHSLALDCAIALGYLRRGAPEQGLLAASPDAPDAPVPVRLHPLPFVAP